MTDNERGRALLKEAFLEVSEEYLNETKVEEGERFILSPEAERRMQKLLRSKRRSSRNIFMEAGKRVAALALTALVSIFALVNFLDKEPASNIYYDTLGDYSYEYIMNADGGEIIVTANPNFTDLDDMQVKTFCVIEYETGECVIKEGESEVIVDGNSISTEFSFAQETEAAIVAVFSEYHFYKNGEYVETLGVDLMQGKDFT